MRKVREEVEKEMKEELTKEKKEEQADEKAAAKKKAEEERISKLSAAEQKKVRGVISRICLLSTELYWNYRSWNATGNALCARPPRPRSGKLALPTISLNFTSPCLLRSSSHSVWIRNTFVQNLQLRVHISRIHFPCLALFPHVK